MGRPKGAKNRRALIREAQEVSDAGGLHEAPQQHDGDI
jgi:hypothetical protein